MFGPCFVMQYISKFFNHLDGEERAGCFTLSLCGLVTYLVALLSLSSCCLVNIIVQWRFLTVPWVGLQCVIVAFPNHTQHSISFLVLTCSVHNNLVEVCHMGRVVEVDICRRVCHQVSLDI